MSILIKGMEKPKECYCCPCSTINMNGRWGKCNLLGRDYAGNPHKIYNDCPLVEIPPHGRLIDADKYLNKVKYEAEGMSEDYGDVFINCTDWVLGKEPTVIESEEREHE